MYYSFLEQAHLNGNVERTLSLSVYPMVGAKENSEPLVIKSKFSFELASKKARVTSMKFQQQQ